MDVFTFLIILAFFVTIIALTSIGKDNDLAKLATSGLIRLLGGKVSKSQQQDLFEKEVPNQET